MNRQRRSLANNHQYSQMLLIALLGFGFTSPMSSTAIAAPASDKPAQSDKKDVEVVLQKSKPLVARTGAWQNYNDSLHVKAGQEKKLTLKLSNGVDGGKALTDLKVELAKQPLATMKDFDGKTSLSCDLTGKVKAGDTPISVHVFGPSGAKLAWELVTMQPPAAATTTAQAAPKLTWVNFLSVPPGQPIEISGSGFSKVASENVVTIGTVKANVTSASDTKITCVVPNMQFPRWKAPIVVTTNGAQSKGNLTLNVTARVIENHGTPMR